MGRSRSTWWGLLKRAVRKRRAAKKRRKAAEKRKAAKTPKTSGRDTGIPVTVSPAQRRDPWSDRLRIWVHARFADEWIDADYDHMQEKLHRQRLRKTDRRHSFVCGAHTPPRRFASAADLNQHLTDDHAEPVQHRRGTVSKPPTQRRMPVPTWPPKPRRRAEPRPRRSEPETADDTRLHLIKEHMTRVRQEAVINMGAEGAQNTLGDIGSTPIRTVGQIRQMMVALEAIGQAVEEAITGFENNARRSEEAPVKEEVLVHLKPGIDGAQQIVMAVTTFLAAFDEEYGPDIREARAGERMNNEALRN